LPWFLTGPSHLQISGGQKWPVPHYVGGPFVVMQWSSGAMSVCCLATRPS